MTDSTPTDAYDTTERVDEYQNGVRLHVRSKRGTGTRDEDKVSGELHADTIEELEANRAQLREHVVATLRELRHNQPDTDLLVPEEQAELADDLLGVLDGVSDHAPGDTTDILHDVIEDLQA